MFLKYVNKNYNIYFYLHSVTFTILILEVTACVAACYYTRHIYLIIKSFIEQKVHSYCIYLSFWFTETDSDIWNYKFPSDILNSYIFIKDLE